MADTSYMVVVFTAEKNRILLTDLNDIDNAISQLTIATGQYNSAKADYDSALNRNCGERKLGRYKEYDNCMDGRNKDMETYQGIMNSADASITTWKEALRLAKENYNSDLYSIQNEIKLQIQAQTSNTTNSTQLAQNQLTLQQNDPRVLLQKAESEAAAKIKSMELQATLDRQKRESNVKIIIFVSVVIVVGLIGWYVIKKIL